MVNRGVAVGCRTIVMEALGVSLVDSGGHNGAF